MTSKTNQIKRFCMGWAATENIYKYMSSKMVRANALVGFDDCFSFIKVSDVNEGQQQWRYFFYPQNLKFNAPFQPTDALSKLCFLGI